MIVPAAVEARNERIRKMKEERAEFFNGLTIDEMQACKDMIKTMREEQERKKAIAKNEEYLREIVISTIDAIGLDETKRIIKQINRDLRAGE